MFPTDKWEHLLVGHVAAHVAYVINFFRHYGHYVTAHTVLAINFLMAFPTNSLLKRELLQQP